MTKALFMLRIDLDYWGSWRLKSGLWIPAPRLREDRLRGNDGISASHVIPAKAGRVAAGGCPPAAPTDPGVPNSGTRLVEQCSLLNGTHCARPAQEGEDRYGTGA